MTLITLTGLFGEWLANHLVRFPLTHCVQLSMIALFLAGGCPSRDFAQSQYVNLSDEPWGLNQMMLGILRFPFDEDGDGYAQLSVVATVMTPTRRFIPVPPN